MVLPNAQKSIKYLPISVCRPMATEPRFPLLGLGVAQIGVNPPITGSVDKCEEKKGTRHAETEESCRC